MLYSYQYPKAKIQKLQSFVNYIMLEVVLRARKIPDTTFSENLVIPKYVPFIRDINPKYIKNPLIEMYDISKKLSPLQLKVLRKAVYENNKIEDLCKGNGTPIRYKDMKALFAKDLEIRMLKNIKLFCKKLYEECLNLAPVYSRYGKIKDYHDAMVQRDDICHFCGNSNLETKFTDVRNAFDHYLAKQTYPFVSVNFKNLVPSCYNCNSLYKRKKDVLMIGHKRYKAFFPFTECDSKIIVNISFKPHVRYSKDLNPEDFNLSCICNGHQEETDNWMRIYDIEKRYKAKCCETSFISSLDSYYSDIKSKKMSQERVISLLEGNYLGDMNFLKIPFFKAAFASLNED